MKSAKIVVALLVLSAGALLFVLTQHEIQRRAIRSELIQEQKQSGLSLVSSRDGRSYTIDFTSHSLRETKPSAGKALIPDVISPNGMEVAFNSCPQPAGVHAQNWGQCHLAVVHADGSGLREYPDLVQPFGMCWSYDNAKLALQVSNRKTDRYAPPSLLILHLDSGVTEPVDDLNANITSQCWSPNGKQLVYFVNQPVGIQIVRVYDTEQEKSRELARGCQPTWSPDGSWIAYFDFQSTYYVVRPSGEQGRVLFKTTIGRSGLLWSPDSRLVAYESDRGLFEGGLEKIGTPSRSSRLRVRRLADHAEDWLVNLDDSDPVEFQWTRSAGAVKSSALKADPPFFTKSAEGPISIDRAAQVGRSRILGCERFTQLRLARINGG